MTTTAQAQPVADIEWWQRTLGRVQLLRVAHPRAARRLALARALVTWTALAATIVALVVVPEVRISVLKSLLYLVPVIVLFLLARTRTVGWRFVAAVFSASVLGSLLIGIVSHAIGGLMGGSLATGPSIEIAAHFEEIGKLLPLGLLAVFAPGRVRRFAAVDWFVLGYAAGAAFMATEEGARAIDYALHPGLDALQGAVSGAVTAPTLFLNPFTVAVFTGSPTAYFPGHQVTTSLIAGSIGMAIAAWRRWPGRRRWWAVAFPALAAALAIGDHALYNAGGTGIAQLLGVDGLPVPVTLFWFVTGRGFALPWLCTAVFVACLLVDVSRRRRAEPHGEYPFFLLPAASARAAALEQWGHRNGPAAAALALIAVAGVQWWSDARLAIAGFPRTAGERRRTAAARGRRTRAAALVARQRAMAATTPDDNAQERERFALGSLALLLGALLFALVAGVGFGGWIGNGLNYSNDSTWPWNWPPGSNLAGLLDFLEHWWGGLPAWEKVLIEVGLVGLLWAYGLPLSLAATRTGYLAYGVGHSIEGRRFLDDPAGSVGHYLLYRSPSEMVADGLDLGLTFAPGRLGIHGPIADTAAFFLGDSVVERVADAPIANVSLASGLSAEHELSRLGLPPGSVSIRPPAPAPHPSITAHDTITDATPNEVIAARSGLHPRTRYEVPGRGVYVTGDDGSVVLVEQTKGGDIALDIANAKPGVEYVRDGWIYGLDPDGARWMRQSG